jgi:hypothetical protein
MRWVERVTGATQIRVPAALTLAAASFLYLAVMTQTVQVGASVNSTASATDDDTDISLGPASWHCAEVPIAFQCGGARELTMADLLKAVWEHEP